MRSRVNKRQVGRLQLAASRARALRATAGSVVVQICGRLAFRKPQYLAVAAELRRGGFNTEVVMEAGKLAKQFKYADRAGIRFVIVLGEDEIANNTVTVKDLRREDQFQVGRHELVSALRVELAQAEALQGTHA